MTNLATKAALNTKTTNIWNKIPDTASFVSREKIKKTSDVCFKLFSGKIHFEDNKIQNFLVFKPAWYTSKRLVQKVTIP